MEKLLFKELETKDEISAGFAVIRYLRTNLDLESYLNIVATARREEGYRLIALCDQNKMVAITGFMPMITLYNGHSIWVCDLVTLPTERSKGYGEKLLNYVHQWAEIHDYDNVALSSGLQREDAHRFYQEKMEYDKTSYVFIKKFNK